MPKLALVPVIALMSWSPQATSWLRTCRVYSV
jgi:hypothetical protein